MSTRSSVVSFKPQPNALSISADYYTQYIRAQRSHWWFRGRECILIEIVTSLVRLPDGANALDVGSGPGGPARALFPGVYLMGLDASSDVLQAYTRLDGRVIADASQLPYRPGAVQAIFAFDILEHLDHDREALANWCEALSPGGWLILTVPAYQALWSRHDEINGHRRRYRTESLSRLLQEADFDVIRLTYFNTLLLPGIAVIRWVKRVLGSRRGHSAAAVQEGELDFSLRLPAWIERFFEGTMRLEARWLRSHRLPAGVSICAVARRPLARRKTHVN